MNTTGNYDGDRGGGRPLSPESIIYALVSLWITLNFIESWPQLFKKNIFSGQPCAVRK